MMARMSLAELARCFAGVNDALSSSLHLVARSAESLACSTARLREAEHAIRRSRDLIRLTRICAARKPVPHEQR